MQPIATTPTVHPVMDSIIAELLGRSPLQRTRVEQHLAQQDELFWTRAEAFATNLVAFLDRRSLGVDFAVDSYLAMCKEMLVEQMKFKRTARYSASSQAQTLSDVYGEHDRMTRYMVGLSLSIFLWPNHYAMYDFFVRETDRLEGVESYLEIGPGHGLYLVQTLLTHPRSSARAVDISPASLAMSEEMVRLFMPENTVNFEQADVFEMPGGSYDYVVMNEVLEHVEDAPGLLAKLRGLVKPSGRVFLTTCANCPAVDHIYLYDDVEHIQRELREAGFEIESEIILPVEVAPRERWTADRVGVNYAAMLAPMEHTA